MTADRHTALGCLFNPPTTVCHSQSILFELSITIFLLTFLNLEQSHYFNAISVCKLMTRLLQCARAKSNLKDPSGVSWVRRGHRMPAAALC